MPRPSHVVLALSAILLVTGCSGDNSDAEPSAATTSSVSLSAADTLVETALQQLDRGEDGKARATFENVLQLDPANVYAHYNLGLLAQDAGDDQRALKHYDATLEIDPEFSSALYNKGIVLETRDLAASVELYRRALEADPELAPAHMRLGFALLHLGEKDAAEEHLSTGVELDPSMADVRAPSYD